MENFKSIILLLSTILIVMVSCNKDLPDSADIGGLRNQKIDIPEYLSFTEQAKAKISKWLAKTCSENIEFKKILFTGIVDVNTGASDELFLLDFINRRFEGGLVKDAVMAANGITKEEFDSFFAHLEQEYYTLVVDVPDYVTWFFHPMNEGKGNKDMTEAYYELPFALFPDVSSRNSNGKWVGYGTEGKSSHYYSDEIGLSLHEIGARESYRNMLPLFIKFAEQNYLFSPNSRGDAKDAFIERYYGDVIEEGKDCIKMAIDASTTTLVLGSTTYEAVKVMEVKKNTGGCDTKLPPIIVTPSTGGPTGNPPGTEDELCDNGIDDDGDGLVDEEDCIYPYEINCSNGIDDDGDGLIDGADSDCSCDCLRDCRQDNNYLLKHTFDEVYNYYQVTSENIPGVEKLIDLRYDITRLNAPACPPSGPCPFTTNHKMVVNRAVQLSCEGYEGDIPVDEWNTLCMPDPTAWNAFPDEGFFYGFVSDNDVWANPTCSNCITFGFANGMYAVLIGANGWITEKSYYLPGAGNQNLPDWDASVYGDMIRVNITELDNDQVTSGTQNTQSFTFSTEFQSTVASKLSITFITDVLSGEISTEESFKFTTSNTRTVQHTLTIQASNLVRLGDIDLIYCDDQELNYQGNNILPGSQSYNVIDEQNGALNWWEVIIKE